MIMRGLAARSFYRHGAGVPDDYDTPETLKLLVANHREFLAFVQRRVGDRALAEEIIQDALVKTLDKLDTIEETAVGWFYRVLRNSIVDHFRRQAAAERRTEKLAAELTVEDDAELERVACACVKQLATTLKPEYATALQRIEVDGVSVKDYATEVGISQSNAGVRIFRARDALKKQVRKACGTCADHGCLNCTCNAAPPAAS